MFKIGLMIGFLLSWPPLGTAEAQECAYECGRGETCTKLADVLGVSAAYIPESCVAEITPWLVTKDCHSAPKGDRNWHLGCGVFWKGPITAERVEQFETAIGRIPQRPDQWKPNKYGQKFFFRMNSEGGDVDAALRLGRLLRNNKVSMGVWDYCASACVYVLVGAVKRTVPDDAVVAIHRPYRAAGVSVGMEKAQDQFTRRVSRLKDYTHEMNVPDQLIDEQVAVSFDDSRRLTPSELRFYLLDSVDPVYQEEIDATEAQNRGISMLEYMKRKKRREKCLDDNHAYNMSAKGLAGDWRPMSACDYVLDNP